MYKINPNKRHETLILKSSREAIRTGFVRGGSGNLYVMTKLNELTTKTYRSLEEVVRTVNSAGHMVVKKNKIYQISPGYELGEITTVMASP